MGSSLDIKRLSLTLKWKSESMVAKSNQIIYIILHRAPLKNWNFVKQRKPQILNFIICVKIFLRNFFFYSGGVTEMCFPSKDVGSRNIGTNISMILDTRKSRFVSQQWLQFHIWFICYRMRQILLQNVTTNAAKVYYKLRQLLQNVSIWLENATVVTKCVAYYKMRRHTHRMFLINKVIF